MNQTNTKRLQGAPQSAKPTEAPLAADRGAQHAPAHQAGGPEPQHDPVHATPRVRQRKGNVQQANPLDIPKHEIPEGSSYEWKRWSVSGLNDPFYIASMRDQGWEPVNPKRHPHWVPPGYNEPFIIKGGMILMERPIELTQEAQKEAEDAARAQVAFQEKRIGITPKDTLTRDLTPTRIVKEVGRMVVED